MMWSRLPCRKWGKSTAVAVGSGTVDDVEALTAYACAASGVTREEGLALDKVNLYQRLGRETIDEISTVFYTRVFEDEEWFRSIFSASTKAEAIKNQSDFLVERLGGPKVYTQRKGNFRLIARHSPYELNAKSAKRWLEHMKATLDSLSRVDEDSKSLLMAFFSHTAFLLVAGKEMMNPSNLIDYHNKMSNSSGKDS